MEHPPLNERTARRNDLLLALGAFVIAFAMWQFRPLSPVVYPLRLFVTFIHELGHGTATLATGGEFIRFQVFESGAGVAFSRGGIRPIIASAGYVGTAIFGAGLLYLANRGGEKRPRNVAILLGIGFTLLTLLYTGLGLHNFNILELAFVGALFIPAGYVFLRFDPARRNERRIATLAIVMGLAVLLVFAAGDNFLTVTVGVMSGVALVILGYYGTRHIILFVLNFLAFIVGLNAITDAWVLFRIVSAPSLVPHNDANTMENVTALPAEFWAFAWIGLAIALFGLSVWLTFIRPLRRS